MTIASSEGMLAYLVGRIRPKLGARIGETGRIETALIGLGRQGTRHAGLMKEYGTSVVAAVAPGRGGATGLFHISPLSTGVVRVRKSAPCRAAVILFPALAAHGLGSGEGEG